MLMPIRRTRTVYLALCFVLFLSVSLMYVFTLNTSSSGQPDITVNATEGFYYHLVPDVCSGADGGRDLFLLVVVFTAPDHTDRRNAIRSSWGNADLSEVGVSGPSRVRTVFTFGMIHNSERQQKALEKEAALHRDVLQRVDVTDSYRNSTAIVMIGFEWASTNCPNAVYLMKTDDDIFLDVYRLHKILTSQFFDKFVEPSMAINKTQPVSTETSNAIARKGVFSNDSNSANILCFIILKNTVPRRNAGDRYYASKSEYPDDYYPPYCLGWGYVFPTSLAGQLVDQFRKVPYFWLEDVHITGTLRQKLGVGLILAYPQFFTYSQCTAESYNGKDTTFAMMPCTELHLHAQLHKNAFLGARGI